MPRANNSLLFYLAKTHDKVHLFPLNSSIKHYNLNRVSCFFFGFCAMPPFYVDLFLSLVCFSSGCLSAQNSRAKQLNSAAVLLVRKVLKNNYPHLFQFDHVIHGNLAHDAQSHYTECILIKLYVPTDNSILLPGASSV